MIFGIYQSLIIYILFVFHDVNTLSVEINGNVSGLLGENGTEIQCLYTMENVIKIDAVYMMAFNRSSFKFESIAAYLPNLISSFTPQGQYLKGRVTLMNITQSSTKAVMLINKLMCIDDTFYKCSVRYTDSSLDGKEETSNNISIQVQAPPLKPYSVDWIKVNVDSSTTPSVIMHSTTVSSSTAVTAKQNETISTLNSGEQNDTNAFNNSTPPTTGHTAIKYTPSNISYSTTTNSIQLTTTKPGLAEGDNITVVCTGDVGKPPAEHLFQKILNEQIVTMQDAVTTTSISEMFENCSYIRTSNLTYKVTAKDNNVVIRCGVNSSMAEADLYIETAKIKVYYEVSIPTIIKSPNNTYYVEGEDKYINLTCKSDGNPEPNYHWYKENNEELLSISANLTIMGTNVTNSGVYTCTVSNIINGDTYRNTTSVNIKIMDKADIPTTQASFTSSSSGVDKKEEKSNEDLGLVIGIVVAVVIVIIVIIVTIACMRRKSKSPTSKNVSKSFDESKPKPVTEPRTGDYDYIALEDDAPKTKSSNNGLEVEDINKHNKEYLKKQEEEEKKKNESNTPPQPAVYAQVNEASKLKNKQKTETPEKPDKQEEDPYAETQEDVYDEAGKPRHKVNKNAEQFDVSINLSKHKSNDDNKLSIQTSHVGSYANQGFEKDENRKVATVSPTVRSSSGSQNDEQTNSNRNSQSKKEYENIIGTDQTGIFQEDSSHRTAL